MNELSAFALGTCSLRPRLHSLFWQEGLTVECAVSGMISVSYKAGSWERELGFTISLRRSRADDFGFAPSPNSSASELAGLWRV